MSNFDLEKITVQLAELQAKVQQQEAELNALKNAKTANQTKTENSKPSRRKLLKGLAVALGGIAAGTLAIKDAQADVDVTPSGSSTAKFGVFASPTGVATNPILPGGVECGVIAITDASAPVNFGFDTGVFGSSSNSIGVTGTTNSSGFGQAGVYGYIPSGTSQGSGVIGRTQSVSQFSAGVWGQSDGGSGANTGVFGTNDSTTNEASGVYGRVSGIAGTIYGVKGISVSSGTNAAGVYGQATANTGIVYGVRANCASSTDGASGLYAINTATSGLTRGIIGTANSTGGFGIAGYATAVSGATVGLYGLSSSNAGNGVYGVATSAAGITIGVQGVSSSPDGYGGQFSGGRAALRLVPDGVSGVPTGTHQVGELLVDSTGQLYSCIASGNPGIWVRVTRGYVAGTNVNLVNNLDGTTTINATAGASGVTGLNGKTGAITLAAGTNVTLDNSVPDTITINASGSSGGVPSVNGITAAVTIQQNGTPVVPAGNTLNLSIPNLVFLTKPIRVVATTNSGGSQSLLSSDGSANPNVTFQIQQITGVSVDGLSVPAGAKAIIGSLTSVGATASGNLRMWATGAATPTVNTLNIPANPATGGGFNLTTSIFVGLNTDGKVSIGYSNGVIGSTCGYSIDVAGYLI
jgi:hypothetical protein